MHRDWAVKWLQLIRDARARMTAAAATCCLPMLSNQNLSPPLLDGICYNIIFLFIDEEKTDGH
jgi:hypothetical protein